MESEEANLTAPEKSPSSSLMATCLARDSSEDYGVCGGWLDRAGVDILGSN